MKAVILLTGFEPFGPERVNPSWEVARRLDGETIEGLTVKAMRLPVNCARAAARVKDAIARVGPQAFLGLGQAGNRPSVSLEQVAINLFQQRNGGNLDGGGDTRAVINGGPDAYFARLPLAAILKALKRRRIPAAISLSAGAYACNATMYAALHTLTRRPDVQAGFIHLPYEARQAARHPATPSMSLEMMEQAVRVAIGVIAGNRVEAGRPRSRSRRRAPKTT